MLLLPIPYQVLLLCASSLAYCLLIEAHRPHPRPLFKETPSSKPESELFDKIEKPRLLNSSDDCDKGLPTARPSQLRSQCGWSTISSRVIEKVAELDRIAGGYAAQAGQFPSYVYVSVQKGFAKSVCGGTIISPTLILSAAHCFEGSGITGVYVKPIITREELEDSRGWTRGTKLCTSADFSYYKGQYARYDTTIVALESPLEFNDRVQPACLPDKPIEDQQVYAVGFGYTQREPDQWPSNLQVMPLKQADCEYDNHESVICFKANMNDYQGDTCGGDSGGPVLAFINGAWTLYGATSYGPSACMAGTVGIGVYANVLNLRSHIESLISTCSVNHENRDSNVQFINYH